MVDFEGKMEELQKEHTMQKINLFIFAFCIGCLTGFASFFSFFIAGGSI